MTVALYHSCNYYSRNCDQPLWWKISNLAYEWIQVVEGVDQGTEELFNDSFYACLVMWSYVQDNSIVSYCKHLLIIAENILMLNLCMQLARNTKEIMTPEDPHNQQETMAPYPQVKTTHKTRTLLAIFLVNVSFYHLQRIIGTQILGSHLTFGEAS